MYYTVSTRWLDHTLQTLPQKEAMYKETGTTIKYAQRDQESFMTGQRRCPIKNEKNVTREPPRRDWITPSINKIEKETLADTL